MTDLGFTRAARHTGARRPRRELSLLPHRSRPHVQRRPHPRIRRPADRRRTHEEGDHPPAQATIAREIFRYLTTPVSVSDVSDLRPARQAKNITLTTVAENFGVRPAVISCIERGTRRDDDSADAYRDWLTAA
ncbi:helix-turn-helix domain-containing protein [Streptomyces sp. NPDC012637]|uniref:helix-turn-helix domain-containing protein n=1 Tax=Streptomyces sp. NPDC012637 TaxID=3364842 RepID=UPI0036EFF7BD